MVGIVSEFLVGSSPYKKFFPMSIAHPVVGPLFRDRGCTERRRSDEAVIMREADV